MNQQELQQIAHDMRRQIERATRQWERAKGKRRRELGRWIADAEVQLAELEQELTD